jgi:hypothetical protein
MISTGMESYLNEVVFSYLLLEQNRKGKFKENNKLDVL